MQIQIESKRKLSSINPMIYGQFIEHFHRQIYGGVYDPGHPAADAEGFRTDVLEAMRKIKVPCCAGPADALSRPIIGRTAWGKTERLCLTRRGA